MLYNAPLHNEHRQVQSVLKVNDYPQGVDVILDLYGCTIISDFVICRGYPHEKCQVCGRLIALSQLRDHITSCSRTETQEGSGEPPMNDDDSQ